MIRTWIVRLLVLLLPLVYTAYKIHDILGLHWGWGLLGSALLFGAIASWLVVDHDHSSGEYSRGFRALVWSASLAMGFWGAFILYSIPLDLISAFTGYRLGMLALGLASVTTLVGLLQTFTGAHVKEVTVPIEDLPAALDGLRIAQISDLHISPTIGAKYVDAVVKKTLALQPDLIAVTGDLVDGTPEWLKAGLEPLRKLRAPLGTYYVLGNHEYYWDAKVWIAQTKELGFVPLVNENRIVRHAGAKLLVAGVTDTSARAFITEHDSSPALASKSDDSPDLRILLAHRPDSYVEAVKAGFDLQLSGHTHAGQFFPFSILTHFVHKYNRGLKKAGRMWVYTNVGTGYWGPPIRFLIPSEITLLKLTPRR